MSLRTSLKSRLKLVIDTLRPPPDIVSSAAITKLVSPSFRELAANIAPVQFNYSLDYITGWLSSNERRALYGLAYYLPGPFLEIGSWAGLSTTCICLGIRDSKTPKKFSTTDLNPSEANFKQVGNEIAFHYPADAIESRGTCSEEVYRTRIQPFVSRSGGVLSLLWENLEKRQLRHLVEIYEGNFNQVAPKAKYRFIFCDATHDPVEIAQNASSLRDFLASGSILACHDMRPPENIDTLKKFIPFRDAFLVDSLFIGEVA
jgi:predicted O-methyltransferase YrrM